MAIDAARTEWGYCITCTGGTAVTTEVVGLIMYPNATHGGRYVQICGIAMTGAATTDKVTVTDGHGNWIWSGVAANTNGSQSISFPIPIRVEGFRVGIAGATTGWCAVYCT
jgi:hypothetical protein